MAGGTKDLVGEVKGEFLPFIVVHQTREFFRLCGFGGVFELARGGEKLLGKSDGAVWE